MIKKITISLLLILIISISLNAKSFRIEINNFAKNFKSYKILDVRSKYQYEQGHIDSALSFPINLTYEHQSINGKITAPNKMQKIIRNLGLEVNDKIVIYGDESFFDATRMFWALEVYGFKNIKLLNASYDEWKNLSLPISNKIVKAKQSSYIPSINNKRLATKFTTQIATKSPSQIIIDARDYKDYIGKTSSAKRFGHIPKAIHIPATINIAEKTIPKLKGIEELKETYKNIQKDKKVVIYCSVGRVSSTNYFALRELGYDVANYDSSWREWGNDLNLPIVNESN